MKLILMRGLPGCGKSTLAEKIMKESGGTVRLNKDLLREMLHFNKFTGKNEGITQEVQKSIAVTLLHAGLNVIIDDTNLNPRTLESWKELAKKCDATFEIKDLTDVDVETCIGRDWGRGEKVGYHVIKKMALQYLDYMKDENVVVCDLDGTLANIEKRRHLVQGEKKWKEFFEAIPTDTLRNDVLKQVRGYALEHSAKIILVSARPEDYRRITTEWLVSNGICLVERPGHGIWNLDPKNRTPYELLIMRNSNDTRPDTEVKAEIVDNYLSELNIVAWFDDRPSVIRTIQEKGINVIDVGDGKEF
jgi:predicted kinase